LPTLALRLCPIIELSAPPACFRSAAGPSTNPAQKRWPPIRVLTAMASLGDHCDHKPHLLKQRAFEDFKKVDIYSIIGIKSIDFHL
jgi:hypothetical protein